MTNRYALKSVNARIRGKSLNRSAVPHQSSSRVMSPHDQCSDAANSECTLTERQFRRRICFEIEFDLSKLLRVPKAKIVMCRGTFRVRSARKCKQLWHKRIRLRRTR